MGLTKEEKKAQKEAKEKVKREEKERKALEKKNKPSSLKNSPVVVRKAEDDMQLTRKGSPPHSPRSVPSSPGMWHVPKGDRTDKLVDDSVEGFRADGATAKLSVRVRGQASLKPKMFSIEHTKERWYEKYFFDKPHQNYVGKHEELGAVALSLAKEKMETDGSMQYFHRAILWTATGMRQAHFEKNTTTGKSTDELSSTVRGTVTTSTKEVFDTICEATGVKKGSLNALMFVGKEAHERLQTDLRKLEDMTQAQRLCLGVVYGRENQPTIDEMLSNEEGSEDFYIFMSMIAKQVSLSDFSDQELAKFAGLDKAAAAASGTKYGFHTRFGGFDIMFHVSTLLPYNKKDKQQMERKRKIGNDIGVIVFKEGETPFQPDYQASKVNQVIGVTGFDQAIADRTFYRFTVTSKKEVPSFGPDLSGGEARDFVDAEGLRSYVLTKMINGVKSAYDHVPGFHREKTQRMLLEDLLSRFSSNSRWQNWAGKYQRRRSVLITQGQLELGLCALCRKAIHHKENGVSAMGRNWHKKCFACEHCQVPFGTSPFIVSETDSKPYCEKDYEVLFCPKCADCDEPIFDYVLRAMGKTWHMTHFCCAHCKEPIGERTFFDKNELPYCMDDYYQLFGAACAKCKEIIVGNYIESEGARWHPECHVCSVCDQLIADDCIDALGSLFHPECFCCDVCKVPFPSPSFYELEGKPLCEEHYYKILGSVCAHCSKLIADDEKRVQALEVVYHATCFTCTECKRVIGDDENFAAFKEGPCCVNCLPDTKDDVAGDDEC